MNKETRIIIEVLKGKPYREAKQILETCQSEIEDMSVVGEVSAEENNLLRSMNCE